MRSAYLAALAAGALAALPLTAAEPKSDEAANALAVFERLLERRAANAGEVLRQYAAIEAGLRFDAGGRARLHAGLVAALRKLEDPALASTAETVLNSWGNSQWPAKVVMLKAMLASKFPMTREKRVAHFVAMARGSHFRLSIWGLRLLGDSRWPEAIDALLELLKAEEAKAGGGTVILTIIGAELYRVLGAEAPQGATSARIEHNWKKLGRKVPGKADYSLPAESGPTVSFFGDLISPRAVFLIDVSSSMRQETTLAPRGSRRSVAAAETGERRERKVAIVKRELERCLGQLQAWYKFNLAGYHAKVLPWRRGLALESASSANIDSAKRYARDLETDRGTNIFDAVKLALPVDELDTIYLLSDGAPSVGGNPAAIERMVGDFNYLVGARIITYGFAAADRGIYDEAFMQRLASENRGWYRRLNK